MADTPGDLITNVLRYVQSLPPERIVPPPVKESPRG